MMELDGKCVCHGRLVPLTEDQKRSSITKFVNMMPGFIDKQSVLSDIFNMVFPNERVPVETIKVENVPESKKVPMGKTRVKKSQITTPSPPEAIDVVAMLEWIHPEPSNGHLHLVFVDSST